MDEEQNLSAGPRSEAMLYDWFKHMTSLTVLSLGGVMALLQQAGQAMSKTSFLIVMTALMAAGLSAFSGSIALVDAAVLGKPVARSVKWLKHIAIVSLLGGIGTFVGMFIRFAQSTPSWP